MFIYEQDRTNGWENCTLVFTNRVFIFNGRFYMKEILLFCSMLTCLITAACNNGVGSGEVIITIGESQKFSENELNEAINCVEEKFKEFKGCKLTDLWYDEEKSNLTIEGYMSNGHGSINGVKPEDIVVFFSNFDVDSSGGESFNPNTTYSDWSWIIIRDSKTNKWELDDWGY